MKLKYIFMDHAGGSGLFNSDTGEQVEGVVSISYDGAIDRLPRLTIVLDAFDMEEVRPRPVKMTVAEIAKKLGHDVEIVKD